MSFNVNDVVYVKKGVMLDNRGVQTNSNARAAEIFKINAKGKVVGKEQEYNLVALQSGGPPLKLKDDALVKA